MKHLKKYNENFLYDKKFSERYGINLQELQDICKYILQELADEGYDPYVVVNDDTITVSIDGVNDYQVFTIEEMEEHISRLERYIGEFGYKELAGVVNWRKYVSDRAPSGNLVIIYKRTGIPSI